MSEYRIAFAVLTFTVFALCAADDKGSAASSSAQQATPTITGSAAPSAAAPEATRKVTAYTLPPDLYKKARDRSRINFRLALVGFVYGLIVLWLILHWKLGAKYRDWAEKFST